MRQVDLRQSHQQRPQPPCDAGVRRAGLQTTAEQQGCRHMPLGIYAQGPTDNRQEPLVRLPALLGVDKRCGGFRYLPSPSHRRAHRGHLNQHVVHLLPAVRKRERCKTITRNRYIECQLSRACPQSLFQ